MEDKRRILEMVREGVLTPEEALELLSALEESALEERDLAGGERPPVEASQVFAPQGFQVQAFGANLEVVGVVGLEGLEAEGGGVTQEGGIPVYRVSLGKGRLRVPEGAVVLLLAMGSHVKLARVVLAGRALGANLKGDGLLGLDLALSGGNLEAGLLLRDGEHRLEVRAGRAELRFLPGSHLEVEAQVRLGGLKVAGPWRQEAAPGGRRWSLGEGKAKLRAKVVMGNLELEA